MALPAVSYSRAAQQNGRSQIAKIDARAVPGKWKTCCSATIQPNAFM
jgi:hypothetical protein